MIFSTLALVLVSLAAGSTAGSADIYVDGGATCTGANGALGAPFCTVTEALAVAVNGDVIRIAAGTYTENLTVTQDVTLLGVDGEAVTLINGGLNGTVVLVAQTASVVVGGLSFLRGRGVGGGVHNLGELTIRNSTISGNRDIYIGVYGYQYVGAAVYARDGDLDVFNSTISGNIGTGVQVRGTIAMSAEIRNSTIVENDGYQTSGGGVVSRMGVRPRLSNSIVAGNTVGVYPYGNGGLKDISGAMTTGGYNLIGIRALPFTQGAYSDLVESSSVPLDPELRPLMGNGASTQTHAPLTSSPIIGAGNPLVFEPFDQRGIVRPGWMTDIGAFQTTLGVPLSFCTATPNSTGRRGLASISGSPQVATNSVTLGMTFLPQHATAFFMASRTFGFAQNAGGSEGNLCLGGAIGRFVGPGQIANTGNDGAAIRTLDLTAIPQPNGFVSVLPGETWYFQGWHRDTLAGQAGSNFTAGVAATWQ